MHTKGPLIPRRRKIIKLCRDGCQKVSMKNMARSKHTELNKIVHYMIQVTGIILFKAYILYASYGSDHVFCKHTDRFEMTIFTSNCKVVFPNKRCLRYNFLQLIYFIFC